MFKGRLRKLNLLAWALALVVIVVGIVMYVVTQRTVFLIFIGLGVLTVVNVIVYDNMVLKPQLRAKKQAAREEAVQGKAEQDVNEESV